jgi:hypothetical protein
MNVYFLLFTVPLVCIALGGIVQVLDEMFGNEPSLPNEGMDRPTAKVQFGLLQPIMARAIHEPLGLRAEVPRVRRPILGDSTIAPLIVVGDFSVLGSLIKVATATAKPLPLTAPPIPEPDLVPAWLRHDTHDSVGHA